MRRLLRRAGGGAFAALLAVSMAWIPTLAQARPTMPGAAPELGESSRALDELENRFLTVRPPLGDAWVVRVGGETTGRILLTRSLQGIVNRTSARMYVIDGGDAGAEALLDRYVELGLVTVAADTGVDEALDEFLLEASGFVIASPSEPWSVHAAAVIAGLNDAVVATPELASTLESEGLTVIDDVRGRWPDAETAYEALAAEYWSQLQSPSLAIVPPDSPLLDFIAQQGILPISTRPLQPGWERMRAIIDRVPEGLPIYGYLSDTGEEEAVAIAALAEMGVVLVPTDTTRNLSFHIAVGADRQRIQMAPPDLSDVDTCTTDTLNVVVGVTDGDNMNVPLNHFQRDQNWGSDRRGDLPLGWSIGPDLAILAPGAWDVFASGASANDELVAMIGWAYGSPALLPDPVGFYTESFALMEELGMKTFWSLGGNLDTPTSGGWAALEGAASDEVPLGVLVGYGNGTGSAYYGPSGRPAFTSRSVYSETPGEIADHIEALLGLPAEDRPIVSFLAATNWSNPVDTLIAELEGFRDSGVRFMTPAEAFACMPTPPDPVDPDDAGMCLPSEPIEQEGIALISEMVESEITTNPTPFDPEISVHAPERVLADEVVSHRAHLVIDAAAFARETLDHRAKPIIEAGYGPEIAASAWAVMDFTDLEIPLRMSAGSVLPGSVEIRTSDPDTSPGESAGISATAITDADGSAVVVRVQRALGDTRTPSDPIAVDLEWMTVAESKAVPYAIEVEPGSIRFDLLLTLGVKVGNFSLFGRVSAPWSCNELGTVLSRTVVEPSVRDSTTTTPNRPPADDPADDPADEAAGPPPADPIPLTPNLAG